MTPEDMAELQDIVQCRRREADKVDPIDYADMEKGDTEIKKARVVPNNGLDGQWYELPAGATELKHLIWYKNMNAQVGEIFRSCYRMDDCPHSDAIRNLNKIIAYAEQEKERIKLYPGE